MTTEIYNIDCMQYMSGLPDNTFALAIADPPYGIGANKMTLGNGHKRVYQGADDWDKTAPPPEFFDELRRVSRNQIIFGANHFVETFHINSSCWIVWDKGTGDNDFADCELAWTSFGYPVRKFFKSWVGANAKERTDAERIHPSPYIIGFCNGSHNRATPFSTRWPEANRHGLQPIKPGSITSVAR